MAALPARHEGRPTPDWIRTAFSSPGLQLRTFPIRENALGFIF